MDRHNAGGQARHEKELESKAAEDHRLDSREDRTKVSLSAPVLAPVVRTVHSPARRAPSFFEAIVFVEEIADIHSHTLGADGSARRLKRGRAGNQHRQSKQKLTTHHMICEEGVCVTWTDTYLFETNALK